MLRNLPFTIDSLHLAYRSQTKVADVISECFRRINQADDAGIFISQSSLQYIERAISELGEFDPISKPLWGIPFAVKDNIDVLGLTTTAGCPDFSYEAPSDSFVVNLLREAGAICVGKTNLDQFATGLVGVRTPYPIPKNAIDPTIVPGGSSSGSAVSVAHGIVTFSLGTDTAGSGRVPAALNSIVGLKPTLGSLSNTGVVPACRTLDTISIFAATVADAYTVFQVAAVYDEQDSYSRTFSNPKLNASTFSKKIGVPSEDSIRFFGDKIQQASFNHTLEGLAKHGAELIELDFEPFYSAASLLYEGVWVAERYAAVGDFLEKSPGSFNPITKKIISQARKYSAADAFKDIYKLQSLKRTIKSGLAGLDFICVPSIPTFYSVADLIADPITPNSNLGTYTNFANFMDMSAITVPVDPRKDGLPGSVTLLATAGKDNVIAEIAYKLQKSGHAALGATDWPLDTKHLTNDVDPNTELALSVCGAHMSGLPLNGELTKLSARYLYTTTTSENYQLFRLAGSNPVRPGLVRTPNTGVAIELEVWAIPLEHVGTFISGIPMPLGIGKVVLKDGSQVSGFICEKISEDGAENISHFGSWRNYIDEV
jgi:allophanate hydrolase